MNSEYDVIFCIVNAGYGDVAIEEARKVGVTGGTILNGTGTCKPDAEEFYGIKIHPDKSVLMMVLKHNLTDKVLHALYKTVGITSPAQGMAFSMPIHSTTLTLQDIEKKEVKI